MPTAEMIVQGLRERTPPVIVAERYGCIRVSPGIFTTDADVDALIGGLGDLIAAFADGSPSPTPQHRSRL